MSTITRFENAKHEDLFRMGKKGLVEASKGRTARAQAAKAEIARREANAIAKGTAKPKKAAKPAAAKPARKPQGTTTLSQAARAARGGKPARS
jgi:hypothetical protein